MTLSIKPYTPGYLGEPLETEIGQSNIQSQNIRETTVKKSPDKSVTSPIASTHSTVKISAQGMELEKLHQEISNMSDVDWDKVAAVKLRMAKGEINILSQDAVKRLEASERVAAQIIRQEGSL